MVTAARTERGGMDIRAQVSMVFHLDKCIGCHTCSIACKNIWTDRKGAAFTISLPVPKSAERGKGAQ